MLAMFVLFLMITEFTVTSMDMDMVITITVLKKRKEKTEAIRRIH